MNSHPTFQTFNIEEDINSLSTKWTRYVSRFENFCVAYEITDPNRKCALLLHSAGENVQNIFDTLTINSPTGSQTKYSVTLDALNEHFIPKRNLEYELFMFRSGKQENDETLDQFHTRLLHLSKYCEFVDLNRELKSQVIFGCVSRRVRSKALQEHGLTLNDILTYARTIETSEQQAVSMEQNNKDRITVNKVNKQSALKNTHSTGRKSKLCYRCGNEYPHQNTCPAMKIECNKCHKVGHFAKCCKSKSKRNHVNKAQKENVQSDNSDDYLFMTCKSNKNERPMSKIKIYDITIDMLVDTGATVNVIDLNVYNTFKKKTKLKQCSGDIFAYGNNKLKVLGYFSSHIESKERFTVAEIYVIDCSQGNLLSYRTAVELGLISEINVMDVESYPRLFSNKLGKIQSEPIKLHIDESVKPVANQRHRRIPYHMRKKVEVELKRLEELDIIEKAKGPTPWISPIVVVPKKINTKRICVDMRQPNRAIERERHITPTIDDIINQLNGSSVFSKLDLTAGYHQCILDEQSRYITTFTPHIGLRRYKRLSFGINSASE